LNSSDCIAVGQAAVVSVRSVEVAVLLEASLEETWKW
jgi:hypothetical protein